MILKALRRRWSDYFRPRATSVSPQITEDDLISRMVERGMLALIPSIERTGIKPPSDPATEGWTWTAWKREFDAGSLPGWAMCRFANRIGPDHAAFVFGIVRGSFGIWRQPFGVCRQGAEPHHEEILTCVTHLRSGLGIGIFADREVAAAAAELADSVCPSWATIEPDDRMAWRDVQHRTVMAWQGVGIYVAADAHCHDEAGGGTFGIFHRSTETIMHGRPEKLS